MRCASRMLIALCCYFCCRGVPDGPKAAPTPTVVEGQDLKPHSSFPMMRFITFSDFSDRYEEDMAQPRVPRHMGGHIVRCRGKTCTRTRARTARGKSQFALARFRRQGAKICVHQSWHRGNSLAEAMSGCSHAWRKRCSMTMAVPLTTPRDRGNVLRGEAGGQRLRCWQKTSDGSRCGGSLAVGAKASDSVAGQ